MTEVEKINDKYEKIGKRKELASLKVDETKPPTVVFNELLETNDKLRGIKESIDEIKNKPEKEEVVNVYYEELGKVIDSLENLKEVLVKKELSVIVPMDEMTMCIKCVETAVKNIPKVIIPNEFILNASQLEELKDKKEIIIPEFPLKEIEKLLIDLGNKLETKEEDCEDDFTCEKLDELIKAVKEIKMGDVTYSGYKDINIINRSNVQINPATEETLQSVAGFNIPTYTVIEATYPTTSSEVYTYKNITTTVGVITVVFSDATKTVLTSVTKT